MLSEDLGSYQMAVPRSCAWGSWHRGAGVACVGDPAGEWSSWPGKGSGDKHMAFLLCGYAHGGAGRLRSGRRQPDSRGTNVWHPLADGSPHSPTKRTRRCYWPVRGESRAMMLNCYTSPFTIHSATCYRRNFYFFDYFTVLNVCLSSEHKNLTLEYFHFFVHKKPPNLELNIYLFLSQGYLYEL